MPITQIHGSDQIQDLTIKNVDVATDAGIYTTKLQTNANFDMMDVDTVTMRKIVNLADGVADNDGVNVGQLNNAITTALTSAFIYKGTLDATLAANLPTVPAPKVGDFYKVTVAGDFENSTSLTDPTAYFNIGDAVVWNGTTWDKIDNVDTVYSEGNGINITTNGTGTETVSVQAKANGGIGVDVDGVYVDLDGNSLVAGPGGISLNQNGFVVGEAPAQDGGDARIFTMANTPVASSEAVYYNGVRMRRGAGNDYTIVGAVITFAAGVRAPNLLVDNVIVDYRYIPA